MVSDRAADILIADSVPFEAAESYGDCLTYPHGHHETWARWQRLGARKLVALGLPIAIMLIEYDAVPRGRIVFNRSEQHFIIYADRRLFSQSTISRIVEKFALENEKWVIQADAHYRT